MAGSNCMGPSAPAELAPEWTPGRSEVPLPDSTVPMAASTVQGSPGQVAAASWYRASMADGICVVAAALTGRCRRRRGADADPAPAPAARTATRRTSPAGPAATLAPMLVGAVSSPIVTAVEGRVASSARRRREPACS